MAADDAGQRVAVGDGDAGKAETGRGEGHLFRMRGAAQEREIGGDGEFGEGGHGVTVRASRRNRRNPNALINQTMNRRPAHSPGR